MNTPHRRILKTVLATAATASLMLAGATAASAHVHVDPDSTAAGSTAVLTFSFAHGCDGSPTTGITISLPEELNDATPTAHPGWDVKKATEKLDTPRQLETGTTITERTSRIVYTAKTPVADGTRDTLQLQVALPAAEGQTLAFPVLQTCEKGSTDWAQLPAQGQDSHDLESPAPSVTLTAAVAEEHGHEAPQEVAAEPAAATTGDGGASAVAGWVGLGAGLLGLAAGGTALVRTRRPRN
ncbi:YcnI family copper-binding membrane protein [Arthrobacter mobilis]|uniref:YcnI family protein n=1 Tax=Arthrobacter mobilis TaxID=2724944 RepID=A0A7X6QM53_9MICC|nr:YcnI family protein [Arthrobacter mobilis]NKX56418.1 YcnI family protein [Arthrobacter mobilis]